MKTAVIRHGLGGFFLLLSAGCGTLVFPLQQERQAPAVSSNQQEIHLSAEALAQYSMSIIESLGGDDEEAIRRYQEAIALDPANVTLQMELAVAYLHRGRYEEMDELLDRILIQAPRTVRAHQLRALGYRIRGRHRDALEPLAVALQLEPAEALHYLEGASIHSRLGDLPAAMEMLEHSLGRVDDRLSVFHALGELYVRQAGNRVKSRKPETLPSTPLEILHTATDEFPEDAYLLSLYGDLLLLHQQMETAIDVFARIEELNPTDLAIRQKLALSLVAVGNRQRAIELLEEIAAKRPQQPRLWFYLAELYEQDDNPAKAVASYEKAIQAQPRVPDGYLKLAYLHLQSDRPEEAIALLITGEQNVPDDPRITEMRAYVYLSQGAFTNAVAAFERVEGRIAERQQRPLLSNFHLNYAIARQMTGDTQGAQDILRRQAEVQPDIMDDFMGLTYRGRDNRDRLVGALEILDALFELVPRDTSSYTLYALIAFNAEDFTTALTVLEQAEQLARDEEEDGELTAQFYFWLGAASERTKDFDKAEAHFIEAIRRQPDHADAHNYLAYMHAERGVKLEIAYDHVGVALAVDPENAAYIDTRGWIYYQMGEYEKARVDIQLAAEMLPDDPTIADHLGDIHLALGNEELAIHWWQQSLAADPDNEEVQEKVRARTPEQASPDSDTDQNAPGL